MNIPNLPERWDLVLFILGFVAVFFNQGNNWMIIFGVFLMGVGAILAASGRIANLFLDEDALDEKEIKWMEVFLSGIGICFLIMLLFIFGTPLFSKT